MFSFEELVVCFISCFEGQVNNTKCVSMVKLEKYEAVDIITVHNKGLINCFIHNA